MRFCVFVAARLEFCVFCCLGWKETADSGKCGGGGNLCLPVKVEDNGKKVKQDSTIQNICNFHFLFQFWLIAKRSIHGKWTVKLSNLPECYRYFCLDEREGHTDPNFGEAGQNYCLSVSNFKFHLGTEEYL